MMLDQTEEKKKDLSLTENIIYIFSPHPDDETYGCGGTILQKVKEGYIVKVFVMTDGGKSHQKIMNVDEKKLIQIRREETKKVCSILGINMKNVFFLGYPDGSFHKFEKDAQEKIQTLMKLDFESIGEVYLPSENDRHKDHKYTNMIVQEVLQNNNYDQKVFFYNIWGSEESKRKSVEVDISDVLEKKIEAIEVYKSQNTLFFKGQTKSVLSSTFVNKHQHYKEKFYLSENNRESSLDTVTQSNSSSQRIQAIQSKRMPRIGRKEERSTVSVVITAYNIQEYIKQAIDSAIKQTVKAYEIIVIDDGSSDNTVHVAKEALKNVHNSKVIVQENSGPGGARNTGIRAATGEYILFLDGDDWLLEDAIGIFNKNLTNSPDAVFSNRKWYYEKRREFKEDNTFTKTTQGVVKTKRGLLRRFAVPSKIFKVKFLKENDIYFPLNMVWEDYPFSYNILAKASKINVTEEITYVARIRSGTNTSITQKKRLEMFSLESRFKQIEQDIEIIYNSNLPKIFDRFNFYKMEYEKWLFWDVKYLVKEKDEKVVNNAFKMFMHYLEKNKDLVLNNVSRPIQNIYLAILDNDLEETQKLIQEYRRSKR